MSLRHWSGLYKYGIYLPLTAARGEFVSRKLRHLLASQYAPRESLADSARARAWEMAGLARSTSVYYADSLADLPLDKNAEWARLPFLTKEQLRVNRDRLRALGVRSSTAKTTGGSTGQPVTVLKSPAAMGWELAAAWRGYGWAGVDIGDLQARFWGVPGGTFARVRAMAIDAVCNRVRFSAFRYSDSDLAAYCDSLRQLRPRHLYGYVSTLVEISQFIERERIELGFSPAVAFTTAELLTDDARATIRRAFGCQVRNEYGCGELGTIAHECDFGRLHVNDENMLLEVIVDDEPAQVGGVGELVVTELRNTCMPLIRYRTGDYGRISDEPCECGRSLTVLDEVFGRAYDVIVSPSGRRYHPEFVVYAFEDARRAGLDIRQFQAVQEAPDRLLLRLCAGPGLSLDQESLLCASIENRFSREFRVRSERVDHLPRAPSGKCRVVIGLAG